MTVLKFRAWDEIHKKMHTNIQFITSGDGGNDWICFVSDQQPFSEGTDGTKIVLSNPYFREQIILMQCTGLRDNENNVDVYEGDRVKMHQFLFDGTEHENEIEGVITRGEYGWMLTDIKNKEVKEHMGYGEDEPAECYIFNFHGLHEESWKVIGNIYETPNGIH